MKFTGFTVVVCAFLLTQAVFAQNDQPIRIPAGTTFPQISYHPVPDPNSVEPPLSGSTIPTWNYSVVSPIDKKTYTGTIIGNNPATKPGGITVVPMVIVPVRLVFQYSSTSSFIFDPTVADPGCLGGGNTGVSLLQASPLFDYVTYTAKGINVGTSQYIDLFQRANFWNDVSASGGANYHTLLGAALLPVQTVTVASANTGTPKGTVYNQSVFCGKNTGNVNEAGKMGVMNISFWDPMAQSLITKLGLSPNTFVFFLFYNTVMSSSPVTACCTTGYHSFKGAQTYGVGDFQGDPNWLVAVSDTSALSHELGEWVNNPIGVNATPAWGHIGQVSGCQANYEVGDPLSGKPLLAVKMPNGFTYHVQELAFFDWYYRISPSTAVNAWYSMAGTFTADAGAVCK